MSETLAGSSRRTSKSTCRKCNRTIIVVVVAGVGGPVQAELDPELISIVISERRKPEVEFARRLHAERCNDYQEQDRKTKIAAELKIFNAAQRRKRPIAGPREPGQ